MLPTLAEMQQGDSSLQIATSVHFCILTFGIQRDCNKKSINYQENHQDGPCVSLLIM